MQFQMLRCSFISPSSTALIKTSMTEEGHRKGSRCRSLAAWPRASYTVNLCLGLLTYKTGMLPTSEQYQESKVNIGKVLRTMQSTQYVLHKWQLYYSTIIMYSAVSMYHISQKSPLLNISTSVFSQTLFTQTQ